MDAYWWVIGLVAHTTRCIAAPPIPPQDLPPTSIVKWHEEPEYEHLDMIWADTAAKNIFVQVAALLRAYSGGSDK